ncbi:MAG TPA: 30S ribosome-binding factor RbfA, partial [Methylomirabilota bacterium]|nr:30S ribosome-binding factor RbfA [Methylomirabilota bacterium]
TVTAVEVSGDLAHARIRVSVMGGEEEKARSLEGLESAARHLRTRLAKTLRLRVAPELRFMLDRGIEHAQRIDRVLKELKEGG